MVCKERKKERELYGQYKLVNLVYFEFRYV